MFSPTIHRLPEEEQLAEMSRRRRRYVSAASGRRSTSSLLPRAFRMTPRRWRRRFAV
jgi:hypothetical protein